jgi:hypothetical protein
MEKKSFFQKLFGANSPKENPELIKSGNFINLQQYNIDEIINTNSIIYLQTQLGFPADNIRVYKSDNEKNKDQIFEFKDPSGVIYGYYEYLTLESESIPLEIITDFYPKEFCKNLDFRTVHKTYVDGKNSVIITGKRKEKLWDEFSLVVIEGSALSIFTIITDENYLFSNPDYAYKIFSTYKFIKNKGLRQRIIKDFICFSAYESWVFMDDLKSSQGYAALFLNPKDEYNILVFIQEADYSSAEAMKEDLDESVGGIYQDILKFKDIEVNCSGGFTSKEFIQYLVAYKNKKFRFCFEVYTKDDSIKYNRNQLKELNIWDNVIDIISSSFYLNF